MDSYYKKYIKYKNKYISLKNQYGGDCGDGKEMNCIERRNEGNEFCNNIKFLLAHGITCPNLILNPLKPTERINSNASIIPENLNIITFSLIGEYFTNPETFYTIFFNKKYDQLMKFLVSPKNNNFDFLGIKCRHHTKGCLINDSQLEFSSLFSDHGDTSNVGIFSRNGTIIDEKIINASFHNDPRFDLKLTGLKNLKKSKAYKLRDEVEQKKFINFLFKKYNHLFCGVRFPGKEEVYLERLNWEVNPIYKYEEEKILDYIFGSPEYYDGGDFTKIIRFYTSDIIKFYEKEENETTLFLLSCRSIEEFPQEDQRVLRQLSGVTDISLTTDKKFEDYQFLYFYSLEVLVDIASLYFKEISNINLIGKLRKCVKLITEDLKNKYKDYFETFINSYSEENNTFVNEKLILLSSIIDEFFHLRDKPIEHNVIANKNMLIEQIDRIKENIQNLEEGVKIDIKTGDEFPRPEIKPSGDFGTGWGTESSRGTDMDW